MLFLVFIIISPQESFAAASWSVGQVKWSSDSHSNFGSAVIQVTDIDMNWNQNEIDKFEIDVWSDSDPIGILLVVCETGVDAGVFESIVRFSEKSSNGQILYTLKEDLVIAKYKDYTLPSSYNTEELEIIDSMIIRNTPANPIENQNPYTESKMILLTDRHYRQEKH